MRKWCLHASLFIFDRIIIKVAGNQDRHKSLEEFDFGPLVSMAHLCFLKWDLSLAHWTQVSDRCPLGYLFKWFGCRRGGKHLTDFGVCCLVVVKKICTLIVTPPTLTSVSQWKPIFQNLNIDEEFRFQDYKCLFCITQYTRIKKLKKNLPALYKEALIIFFFVWCW